MTEKKSGIIVGSEPGYSIPDLYMTTLFKTKPESYGCVRLKKGNKTLDLFQGFNLVPEYSKIRSANKAAEPDRIQWWFGPKQEIADNIQPFRLLVEDKSILTCATLTGDFKKNLPANYTEKHTPEWWTAFGVLMPKLQQILRLCKGDMRIFETELQTAQMQKEIGSMIGLQGGMISLMLLQEEGNPTVLHYAKSLPTFKKFDNWGYTSDVLDYVTGIETKTTETTAAKPAEAKKKPAVVLEEDDDEEVVVDIKKKNNGQNKAQTPIITASEHEKPNNVMREVSLPSGGILYQVLVDGKEVWLWKPPLHLTKRKQLRAAYKAVCGRSLSNKEVDTRIGVVPADPNFVKMALKEGIKSLGDLGNSTAIPKGSDAPRAKAPTVETQETVKAKDTVTGNDVTTVVAETEHPQGGTAIYSTLSNKDKYDVKKYLQTLDNNGQAVLNPIEYQEIEDTTLAFYKEIGYYGFEQTLGWSPEVRYAIAKASPRAMSIWTGDLIRRIANLDKELAALLNDPAYKSSVEDDEEVVVNLKDKGKKKATA